MARKFQNLTKIVNLQIQKRNRRQEKEKNPRFITIELLKNRDKEKTLKVVKGKKSNRYRRIIRNTSAFMKIM